MVTIDTSEDIIRALQEDPDLLRQVQRAIMTDEVLALPNQFADMRQTQNAALETQNRILAELADTRQTQNRILAELADTRQTQNSIIETQNRILADQEDMRQTQNRILAELADTRQTQNSIIETQNKILAELEDTRQTQNGILAELADVRGDIRALHGMYRRQHDDFRNFRGAYAENAARKYDRLIARRIASARGHRVRLTERISYEERSDLLLVAENLDTSGIDESSWDTFPNADVILRVTERNRAETQFYIVVEASYTGARYDFKRTTDHAKLLRITTGLEAYAIVAGVRLNQDILNVLSFDAEDFVKTKNEDAALWYKLPEATMDPL